MVRSAISCVVLLAAIVSGVCWGKGKVLNYEDNPLKWLHELLYLALPLFLLLGASRLSDSIPSQSVTLLCAAGCLIAGLVDMTQQVDRNEPDYYSILGSSVRVLIELTLAVFAIVVASVSRIAKKFESGSAPLIRKSTIIAR